MVFYVFFFFTYVRANWAHSAYVLSILMRFAAAKYTVVRRLRARLSQRIDRLFQSRSENIARPRHVARRRKWKKYREDKRGSDRSWITRTVEDSVRAVREQGETKVKRWRREKKSGASNWRMNGFFNSLKNLASGAANAAGSASRYEELEGEAATSANPSRVLMSSYVYIRVCRMSIA